MFFKFDRDRSGSLEKREVIEAVRSLGMKRITFIKTISTDLMFSLGYNLSPEAVNILFNRFARHRKYMNIDDFAACLSRVKIMNGRLHAHTIYSRIIIIIFNQILLKNSNRVALFNSLMIR